MKTVFIFGAGASREAGGPLMSDFLDMAEEIREKQRQKLTNSENGAFQDVSDAKYELESVYAKSYLEIDNIETLFGAIEMAQIIKKFGEREQENIKKLKDSIITVIVKTLEYSIEFPVRDGRIYPPRACIPFIEILEKIMDKGTFGENEFVFLTFNYDLLFDFLFNYYSIPIDYCLSGEKLLNRYPYIKLHGSINWGICPDTGEIIPRYINELHFSDLHHTKSVIYSLGSKLSDKKNINGKPIKGPPVLVPPTWNKSEYHNNLSNLWKKAAEELAAAENIFVIGYSLPETDSFFRYLYALGSASRTKIKKFWVFDPDPKGDVKKRFESLIGPRIANSFEFYNIKFSKAAPIISKAFG